jgi:hypothetical protein
MPTNLEITSKKNRHLDKLKRLKNIAGFTLVELLLYMGLFTGFIVILSGLFISTLEAQLDASSNSRTSQDSWYLISRLGYDFYRSTTITAPSINGETTGHLILENDISSVTYSLVNNKITITENGVTTSLLSENVMATNLSFEKLGVEDGSSTVSIYFELQGGADQPVQVVEFTLGER